MTIWIQYTKMKQLVAFSTVFQTLESSYHKARTKNGPENNVLLWSHKPKKFLHSEGIFNVQRFEVFVECVIFSTKDDPAPSQKYTCYYSTDTGVYNFYNLGPLAHTYMLIGS